MITEFNGTFESQSIKKDGIVVLIFKAAFSEIAETLKVVRMIQKVGTLTCQLETGETIDVGKVTYRDLRIDRQGETRVQFETELHALKMTLEEIGQFVDCSVAVQLND